ncbi:uncharacterized protein BP01DRAFT_295475 [Aspergillus saccharolyticus JOP 1030-1]|uniref:P-loop containing nucleoside triphosphate hydrolase protein n=1 Tax=Aspergillus saccharolyticus JOP 1030-1 TaxID=1450539 RepID=A0A319A0J4_9EURO|nr:hypothetical protein BP01DRAFT_295475 [Aspergillus saccharolyticus JOP 1030-1]PYH45818.1 hypothetical protein BP01DRAFT_295475 [Aspergillus saccharolyticus JOP 1030-1]
MSQKPIFVATHPRACSTAFERVFMTQRDTIQCVHEPFGDAFYYGPERLSTRFADDEQARLDSGFSQSTFKTVLDRIERESSEGKRVFIKDIIHYLLPPHGQPASIAPSLHRIKRGVGTDQQGQQQQKDIPETPYPYSTEAEPGNPTVMPRALLSQFHFAFLIRDPHYSVPSYYRCTIPPLDAVTGFQNYDPSEAGYDELRRTFDYLRATHLVGPRVATYEAETRDDSSSSVASSRPSSSASSASMSGPTDEETQEVEICVVDADDMLDNPAPMIEAFCRSVGLKYDPSMLCWDTEADHAYARAAFEKWRGFHNDAIESTGLVGRKHPKARKSEAEFDAEWLEKYGPEGAALIRKTVDDNMEDYLYLKRFAMKV